MFKPPAIAISRSFCTAHCREGLSRRSMCGRARCTLRPEQIPSSCGFNAPLKSLQSERLVATLSLSLFVLYMQLGLLDHDCLSVTYPSKLLLQSWKRLSSARHSLSWFW
jgi:hypothetical protein